MRGEETMKIEIGRKIAEYRKEKSVTQEQLAHAIGVSTAAVSKWETGNTYPDITLLPDIAAFFQVSVDLLLDYRIDQAQQYKDRIRELAKASDYQSGLPLAEEALRKFPNDFDILMDAAYLSLNKGTSCEPYDREALHKSIEYFNKSLMVKPRDSIVKKENIYHSISYVYDALGEHEKAISMLEEININGCYNPEIANYMLKIGDHAGAKSRLQMYLWQTVWVFGMVTTALGDCYRKEGKPDAAIDLQRLHAAYLQHFTHETPSYSDLICTWSWLKLARYQGEIGELDGMWNSIGQGVRHAVRFDKAPSYDMESIKFMDGSKGWLGNNSSENACQGALNRLKDDFPQYQNDEKMIAYIRELEAAATDKVQAGVWSKRSG
jgi:transcriptional regulator with XRE-family HTH domain